MSDGLEQLYAVIVAAGGGLRMGGPVPQPFLALQGKPLVDWSLRAFEACEAVVGIVLVVPEEFVDEITKRLWRDKPASKLLHVVAGGAGRQESVRRGLLALPPEVEWVAVHDAVRPFLTPQLIAATFTLAQTAGAAIPTVAIHDTLVQVDEVGLLVRPISRDAVKRSQTPQIFKSEMLADAHERAAREGLVFADDAMLVRHYGYDVATFVHYGENRKISTSQDLEKITMQKSGTVSRVRVGQGFHMQPVAPPEQERSLVLGGVRFLNERGLAGAGDGDVITRAVCDALLGAAGLGDLSQLFPASDPAYRTTSSMALLQDVAEKVRRRGLDITFVDATLIGEKPRIASRRDEMREKLAAALGIDPDCVSIKSSTGEGLAYGGGVESLAALALATLSVASE